MSHQFSAAIKLGDLDDYLSPANECVVVTVPSSKPSVIKPVVSKQEQSSQSTSTVAGIALSDCLACSGCVTSAETVLLQSQSIDELLKTVSENKLFFVSISSASRRALSAHFQIPPSTVCGRVQTVLSSVIPNVVVVDTSLAEAIAVHETSLATDSSLTLSSHCPGWTCYATKVLGDSILPHLSRVKSPEQFQGLILRHIVSRFSKILYKQKISNIYHILVSPCFDKKLEVLRPHYTGVQMVISTTELIDLMKKTDGKNQPDQQGKIVSICRALGLLDSWAVSADEDSVTGGGYARAMTTNGEIEWVPEMSKKRPNVDLMYCSDFLIRSHGFRNIQNITRRVKEGKLSKGFVEIMACPGGCPRGGGQPSSEKEEKNTNFLSRVSGWFSRKNRIDPLAVDHIGQPATFSEAMRLRSILIQLLGQPEWDSLTKTEWVPIESISSVKW
jgi:iron only hydrogenase large subunit-like protein